MNISGLEKDLTARLSISFPEEHNDRPRGIKRLILDHLSNPDRQIGVRGQPSADLGESDYRPNMSLERLQDINSSTACRSFRPIRPCHVSSLEFKNFNISSKIRLTVLNGLRLSLCLSCYLCWIWISNHSYFHSVCPSIH